MKDACGTYKNRARTPREEWDWYLANRHAWMVRNSTDGIVKHPYILRLLRTIIRAEAA